MASLELADSMLLSGYLLGEDTMLVAASEALVRAYCGWHVAPSRDETFVMDGPGGHELMLPSLYVTEVASVTEDDVVLVADTDYEWSANGRVWTPGLWTTTLRGISVDVTHGYDVVPLEVQAVVLGVASRAAASPNGIVSQTAGPFSVTYSQTSSNTAGGISLLALEMSVLDRYKIASVA